MVRKLLRIYSGVLFFVNVLKLVELQRVVIPENPCPGLFQYNTNGRYYFGEIQLPYDGSGILELTVNSSYPGYHQDANLGINLETPKEQLLYPGIVKYSVDFPYTNLLPKITQIKFNDVFYCIGAQALPSYDGRVTNIWTTKANKVQVYGIPFSFQNTNPQIQTQSKVPLVRPTVSQIPVQEPQSVSLNKPDFQNNPFLNSGGVEEPQVSVPDIAQVSNVRPQTFPRRPDTDPSTNKPTRDESCGIANDAREMIIGGQKTVPNEFPWMVAIYEANNGTYEFACSGNLVSKLHVITAGHCVRFFNAITLPKDNMLLIMGSSDLTRWATNGATLRSVQKIIVHPEYKQYTGHGDLAILKLNEPVTITNNLRPICLWNGDSSIRRHVNKFGVVTGWEKNLYNKMIPKMKKVPLPIVSQETCMRANNGNYDITTEMTFCAGNQDGRGPCIGDSGSAFMLKINGRYYLRGLVSIISIDNPNSDEIDCELSQYVVFCDAAKAADWIKTTIANNK